MSEKKKIAIPESIQESVTKLKKDFDSAAAVENMAKRNRKIAKMKMFNVLEDVLPELATESYSINYDTMEVEVKECNDCGSPGLPSHLVDMLKGMTPGN